MACVLQTAQGNCVSSCFIPSWCAPCEGLEGWVFNTHINFDEIVCNNKAAISTSQKWSISHQQTPFSCCGHPCKNTCGSTNHWKWLGDRFRMFQGHFAQCICVSAQGEEPLEGTEEHPTELPGSQGWLVLGMWHLEEALCSFPPQISDCARLRQSLKAVQEMSSSPRSWRWMRCAQPSCSAPVPRDTQSSVCSSFVFWAAQRRSLRGWRQS